MTTPIDELPEPEYDQRHEVRDYATSAPGIHNNNVNDRSSDEDGTIVDDNEERAGSTDVKKQRSQEPGLRRQHSHLTMRTAEDDHDPGDPLRAYQSHSRIREQNMKFGDDLEMLKIERQVSKEAEEQAIADANDLSRTRSRRDDTIDEFDIATNPIHERTAVYTAPARPVSKFAKFIKRLHQSNYLVRWLVYITPLVLILLIPLLLGALLFKDATVGHVQLVWFMIWLEIVWLTLWAGRLLAKCLPWPIGVLSSLVTNNSKKWRDMGKQLELPATFFFWWLAIEISFLPTMKNHQIDGSTETRNWMNITNKVIVSIFVAAVLNFFEKILIQLIAISFHLRTYADRIEINKFQIGSLTKLYIFSKEKLQMEDREFEAPSAGPGSGARTPGQFFNEATKQTKEAVNKFGDVAGKALGDFTGKKVSKSTHPNQVILALLNSTTGSQVLARRLYRTFAREETQTVHQEDLTNAFENASEADAAFTMFDKDMNGDISMEELEAVCVEIGRERKSITASLKDLDSVVSKLDDVFMFIVFVVFILVLISLISTSAAGVLTSLGSSVLALSWLFSVTAQEFLQSCIFVFVKHPFDVGDRVTVYGNQGATGTGDDYFVKEISLLYTEFKKMEGHVVQAPNSYLNTLFILNQRRSGGLAEAVSIDIKYGTTLDQIEGLRNRLLAFVTSEKREYQSNILTELRKITEAHSISLNVVFFYKSNWQNEGLRLARRNKFICALMVTMQELGIEGPRMRYPGQKESFPVYLQNVPHMSTPGMGRNGNPDNPTGWQEEQYQPQQQDPPFVPPAPVNAPMSPSVNEPGIWSDDFARVTSIRGHGPNRRQRAESLSQMNRRVDFSLGARDIASGDFAGDVYQNRTGSRLPPEIREISASREREAEEAARVSHDIRRSHEMGRSTSRASNLNPGRLARRSTDNGSRDRFHRNRFFGRPRGNTADEQFLMESGMADIPEDSGSNTRTTANNSRDRLDPRSGIISPAAINTTDNVGGAARAPQLPPVVTNNSLENTRSYVEGERIGPEGYHPPRKYATEDFEMRTFR
ncbi:hypothetical protein MBLNU457_g0642t1 [Dothideomycetes sp. NU457]